MWIALTVVIVSLLALVVALALLSVFSPAPRGLGVTEGQLADCPPSPNCVCSQASDGAHRSEPIPFTGPPGGALERLKQVVQAMPRTRIVKAEGHYLHAEFTSAVFRYVDDVQFLIDPAGQVIHFRSASRAGHSDLGVNRARMEEIRRRFAGG